MGEKRYSNRKLLIPSLLFVLVGLIILYVFPRETKFKYEFDKGKPWQHERLIAPFSFAINKTKVQIETEKDSIIKYNTPYFVWSDQQTIEKKFDLINSYFPEEVDSLERKFISHLLNQIYEKYIISPIDLERIKQFEIVVQKGTRSFLMPIQDVYTPKKMYLLAKNRINEYVHQNGDGNMISILKNIDIENYLINNIEYNQKLTDELLNQKIEKISTTRGLVQKGELIISKGEIINDLDYEVLRSYRKEYQKRYSTTGSFVLIIGNLLLITAALSLLFLFLFQYRKKILLDVRKLVFILSNLLFFIIIILLVSKYKSSYIYLMPVTILPIVIRSFFDTRLANFIYTITLLIMAYLLPNAYQFVFIQFISGTVALFSLSHIVKRSHIFRTSLIVFVSYIVTYYGMSMVQEGSFDKIDWIFLVVFAANSLMISLSYPIVYLFEKIFGFTSDVTLLELSDTNHPLLKKLSEKAPGTFQHSLQVANIAESLIQSIGGNPLLVRTGALYHDVGKLKNPAYFTENQLAHFNPHNNLTCEESAEIIIQHVHDGVKLAKKYNLPKSILEFIPMHQGTLTVKFFLTTFKQKYPDKDFDLSKFTYPGPKPYSKETAVVMIADSIEAASRSLKEYSPESIEKLINGIIDYQLEEKQFENVNITFKDINIIKQVLKEKLATIYHTRIAYPEEEPLVV